MQQDTGVSDLRAQIDAAIIANNSVSAQTMLAQLWRERPGPTLAGYINSRFTQIRATAKLTPATIAILRSYTLEPTVPVLRAAGFVHGLDLNVHIGDFNTYAQEILSPQSPLYTEWKPDVTILAIQLRDIAPELWSGGAQLDAASVRSIIERVLGEIRTLVRVFRERSHASLIIHTMEMPQTPSTGILDAQNESGQFTAIRMINAELGTLARQFAGVYILDYDGLIARCGRDAWYDERKWLTMRMPIRAEWHASLAQEWLRFLHPLLGCVAKAIVVDLDNTLWGGVIGEDGREGIKIGQEYPGAAYQALQQAILDLYARGIILAVCSKNNPEDALDVLENHPGMLLRPHHFAALRINWQNKAENLRSIAKELNIGIDALAFIDDNPAECQLIRSQLPEVAVIELPADPGLYAALLRSNPIFERLTLSSEDRERGRYYAEQRQRSALEQSAGSVEEFLISLQTQIVIALVGPATITRTAQLTQKTNQFNLTTRRYSEQDIALLASDDRWRIYTVQASDRFGDHGLIGVAMLHCQDESWDIDTLLLSCRVIGRTVETAILATIADLARADGVTSLTGSFLPTKKNVPAREFYPSHGFTCTSEQESETRWLLDLTRGRIETPGWITCQMIEETQH
jgi:FkbH-like protein